MSFVLAFYSRGTYFHLTKAISNLQKLFIIIVSWQPGGVFGPDIKQRGGTAEIIKWNDIFKISGKPQLISKKSFKTCAF